MRSKFFTNIVERYMFLLLVFLTVVFLGLLYVQYFRHDGFSDSTCPDCPVCPPPPPPIKINIDTIKDIMNTTPGFSWEPRA